MYTKIHDIAVEDKCFNQEHVEKVLNTIKHNFEPYFVRFLDSAGGKNLSMDKIQRLQQVFGTKVQKGEKYINFTNSYDNIMQEAIDNFEKDREDYKKIFRQNWLKDLFDDADTFKLKILKNECPIIRKTLVNKKAKELDKYRAKFNSADPDLLLKVVYNLCVFGDEYQKKYNPQTYEHAQSYEELNLEKLDSDDYTAYGVIGGGIKTHMLYKVYPSIFPNRSRSALWALWYLTNKETFGCQYDSEFLMIDTNKNITQQNYFYPYQLFAFYAFCIYKMLRQNATKYNVFIDTNYRYVIVDSFLEFIAMTHDDEITTLKTQIIDGGMGYA